MLPPSRRGSGIPAPASTFSAGRVVDRVWLVALTAAYTRTSALPSAVTLPFTFHTTVPACRSRASWPEHSPPTPATLCKSSPTRERPPQSISSAASPMWPASGSPSRPPRSALAVTRKEIEMLGHRALNVEDYMAILKRHWWVIAGTKDIFPVLAVVATFTFPPQYVSRPWCSSTSKRSRRICPPGGDRRHGQPPGLHDGADPQPLQHSAHH